MKIYLFYYETGVYLGEDFADKSLMKANFVVPPDATTIAPPQAQLNQILVFNADEQCWEVRPREQGL